jgi:drug/metabolite transporter (DMT)-like permease
MSGTAAPRWKLLGAAALFSTGGAAIKACSLGGWQVAGLRSAIAVLAFLAFVPAARRLPSARSLAVSACYAACLVMFVLSNKLTTAADAIFLQSAAPLYILGLAPLLLRERTTRRDLLLMLVIAAGIGMFFLDERGAGSSAATAPDPWLGRMVALGSGVAWAFVVIGLRALSSRGEGAADEGPASVAWGNALAALACAPFALATPEARELLVGAGARDWLVVLWLGVFQIAVAYALVTAALRAVPAFEASVILLVEPVFNPVWAWAVHGEVPTRWAIAGGSVIVAATLAKTWLQARGR